MMLPDIGYRLPKRTSSMRPPRWYTLHDAPHAAPSTTELRTPAISAMHRLFSSPVPAAGRRFATRCLPAAPRAEGPTGGRTARFPPPGIRRRAREGRRSSPDPPHSASAGVNRGDGASPTARCRTGPVIDHPWERAAFPSCRCEALSGCPNRRCATGRYRHVLAEMLHLPPDSAERHEQQR